MPPQPNDEERFKQSKMSFGEHLEELRRALFKSIIALFVGFLFGLYFGNGIVAYIQTPLRESLERFYQNQAERKQLQRLDELKALGEAVPESYVTTAEELAREGLMFHEYLIAPEDLRALLASEFPELQRPVEDSDQRAEQIPPDEAPVDDAAARTTTDDSPSPAAPGTTGRLSRRQLIPLRLYQPIEEDARVRIVALNAQEPFMVYIRTAFIAGIVFASPFIFYFIWEFVAAGLYRQEQSYVYTYLPFSLGLFVAGASLAFYYAFEPLLDFLFWYYERMEIEPDMRLDEWISFVLLLPLGFGVSFQLPLVMLLLERIGIFTVESYRSRWRAAVVGIAVVAMLLTPSQDPYSMLLMGAPLVGLYFGGIWLCTHMPGAKREPPGHEVAGS